MNYSKFPDDSPYRRLAAALDRLPNRFPRAEDESDLRLLAKLYTREEADLAASLMAELETVDRIAARLNCDSGSVTPGLKQMAQKGLIRFGKTPPGSASPGRPGFGLLPFVVGVWENQAGRVDAELAGLFEQYYKSAFYRALSDEPQFHRVVPVNESIKNDMEVHPYESVSGLLDRAQAWGVMECICRVQKALVGEPCQHPIDVCMVLSQKPGAFAGSASVRALTREEAIQTLKRAADAGLVHCVSNHQQETWYICNCCTCSCGILRGMAEMGIANVVARSAFVNQVDIFRCASCGECVSVCSFNALTLEEVVQLNEVRCVGCGVCVPVCPQGALGLVRRDEEALPPVDSKAWAETRKKD